MTFIAVQATQCNAQGIVSQNPRTIPETLMLNKDLIAAINQNREVLLKGGDIMLRANGKFYINLVLILAPNTSISDL